MTNNKELTSTDFDNQKMENINNKQRTAVDSIIQFCKKRMFMEASVHQVIYLSLIKFCQEQAKEMEKEQIAKAFDDGDYNYHYSRKTGDDFENGKEYYQEVYGKEI
jgi:hypothetical protein